MNDFSIMVREERPDYKAVNNGFQSLDIVELLSLIIGQGNDPTASTRQARQLINVCGVISAPFWAQPTTRKPTFF